MFRSLVTARLSFPASKRAMVEYLKSLFAEDHNLFRIYRYMDRLNDTMRERIQEVRYKGHTMLPVVTDFVRCYKLEDFVIVADSGMMSDANVRDLEANGYQYVVGAQIKNMSSQTRE